MSEPIIYNGVEITHVFNTNDTANHPDLLFRLMVRELVKHQLHSGLTTGQAVVVLSEEAEFIRSQINNGAPQQ